MASPHKILTIVTLLLCCRFAMSQQLNFDTYNSSNGLVNNEVHYIMQGSNNFMYFGTPLGVSIYDGASFKNYDLNKGFRHNYVSNMQEMHPNEIVLFTNSNRFYKIIDQRLSIDSSFQNIAVKNIYYGKSGAGYACSYSGLYLVNGGKLRKLTGIEGNSFEGINCVMEWQDSLLIVGRSYEPLTIYNIHTWKRIAASSEKLFVRNIFKDREGNIWIASIGSGVLLLKPTSIQGEQIHFEKLPFSFLPFLQAEFRAIVQDKEKNLWMGSINKGLIKFNPITNKFLQITIDQGLISNNIYSLFCDKEDNIWIGTNKGVQKLVHKNYFSYSSKQGLPADLVLDVQPLSYDRIITCGYSGVGYIKKPGEKAIKWHPPLADEYFVQFTSLSTGYFGLSLKKLIALNISLKKVSAGNMYSLPEHFRSMVAFKGDKLLLGGDRSILLFNKGKLDLLTRDSVHPITCMAMDASGILWTGSLNNTINGYNLPVINGKISASIAVNYQAKTSGRQDLIQCITAGKKNSIIYGTSQSGIVVVRHVNNQLNHFTNINTSSGLSNNNVQSLAWYNDTILLAGTGYGLDKIIFPTDKDSFYIHNLNDYYNFSSSVYSIKKNEAGNIIIGTEAGMIKIPSIDIENNFANKLPVVISSISLLSNTDSLMDVTKAIELPYNNNGINIYYSSPSFINEKNNKYSYLLTGGNQNQWSKPSISNHVTLLNLSPGHYRFLVRPVSMFGDISTETASVDIVIQSAFWQKWWFILLMIVAVVALLYFLVRKRIAIIRRESSFKNKIAETEMMALRAQMNPHFIFNCMNILDGLITGNRKIEAQGFLQKFSKLLRLVLENSQYQQVPLQQDLQALKLYTELEAIRSNHQFDYQFEVDEELVEENYKIPPLLLQPYIENAIIHGLRNKANGGGRLFVSIRKQDNVIMATIEDNGVGRKKAMQLNEENKKPHQPLGIKVTAKRIDLLQIINHNKVNIEITDMFLQEETGTRVIIKLPLDLKFE